MQITIDLPDDVAQTLRAKHPDFPRYILEAVALEGFRSEDLTAHEVRRLLSFKSRFDVDAFFKQAGVSTYTLEDFEQDCEASRRLRAK